MALEQISKQPTDPFFKLIQCDPIRLERDIESATERWVVHDCEMHTDLDFRGHSQMHLLKIYNVILTVYMYLLDIIIIFL